jgi:hypothetical protein
MTQFKPCVSKTACTETGDQCLSCGRPHWQINETRKFIDEITQFILQAEYENVTEFTDYLTKKINKKVEYRKKQMGAG